MADELGGPGWYTCSVVRTGPAEGGDVVVMLHHEHPNKVFTDRWFVAVEKVKQEMLAVALFALASGYKVTALLEDSEQYAVCKRLYMVRP